MKHKQHNSSRCLHPICSAAGPVYSRKPEVAAIELIDGAYDIIELWKPQSPSQEAWRNAWLVKAKELGAHPSW
jgi:hypothetical protein